MLFRKDIEPRCLYCRYGKEFMPEQISCPKKGVVGPGYHCRKFRYDPLKRTPPKQAVLDLSRFQDEDFTL